MTTGLFIFRRDLRLHDNLGLHKLRNKVGDNRIIPLFILDPAQVHKNSHNEHYFSSNALQFMCESLIDLHDQCGLVIIYGDLADALKKAIAKYRPDVVGWNRDWSALARKRDKTLRAVAEAEGVEVCECDDDYTLWPPTSLARQNGEPYRQFGAFYKHAKSLGKAPAVLPKVDIVGRGKSPASFLRTLYDENDELAQRGGRKEALKRLRSLATQKKYNEMRDRLDFETSNLSAALNFGCISVREAFAAVHKVLGRTSDLLKQFYWRDFFLMLIILDPNARSFRRHMDPRFDDVIRWRNSSTEFAKLWNARTGFLLIDAAMMQMKRTGFMHNRARMLVAVFWTKYLRIHIHHPKYGSQCGFSRLLVDAIGPSQNKMNHHWVTELDMPGRRYAPKGYPLAGRPMDISNEMIRKWDPQGVYVRKWLPHLADVDVRTLVKWKGDERHPGPMFDAKERYKDWIISSKR